MTELQNGLLKDTIIEKDYIIMEGKTYYIKADIYDDCYNEGNFIGTFIMKRLEFEYSEDIDFKQKEFKFYKSFKIDSEWKTIDYGTFIVQSIEQSDTEETVKITAYDYALKFAQPYETQLDYGSGNVTLWQVFEEILGKLQIATDLKSFTNSNFIVDSNQFVEGYSYGNVMAQIAGISGNFAHIYNDKMCLIFTNETDIIIEKGQYSEFEDKRDANLITVVVIEDGVVEGENISKRWEEGIELYGENYFKITGNLFAYTQAKKQQLITALFDKIKGFSYSAMKLDDCLFPELKCGDKIKIRAKDGNLVESLVLRWQNVDYSHTLEAPSIIKATVAYENPESALDISRRTEIIVNKQNQTIESVVSQTDTQNEKINRVVQTVDELNSKISDIADITISKDSNNGLLEFENINQSEPIRIEIRPIGENISYLYPNNNLFPSNELFSKTRKIRFTNIETEKYIDYELPNDLLYYDSENYDEFILDYNSQTCLVNKRVGYNSDGTTYILETPTTIEYDEYPSIPLTDGDYKVELLGYNLVYMFVRLMAQNIYTTQFATKAEVNSEISQTKDTIRAEVNADITTLNQNVDREVKNINAKLELKVDTKNLISELNASAGVINLKSNRFKLESDNLSIAEDGTMTCNNAVIRGSAVVNDAVTINKNGIEMSDGTSIIGATGVFSIFEYDGEVSVFNPVRNGKYQSLGMSYYMGLGDYDVDRMTFDAYIPENFTIKNAYILFSHYPTTVYFQSQNIGKGYCRNLKLYKADSESMETLYMVGGEYANTYENSSSQEIKNAFGVSSYTPSSSTLTDKKTIDLASYLKTGKNRLIIKSTATKPSGNEEYMYKQTALMTGMAQATLVVLGFSK